MDLRQFVAFWTLFLVSDCQKAMIIAPSPCSLPKIVGPCEALTPRWFYNAATGQCEQFNYGGCQGNTNNFEDEISCTELCEAKPGTCPEPGAFGICVEMCSTDADCPKDDLCCSNGCGHVCKSPVAPPVDRCQLPIVGGYCRAYIPSWGFNAKTGRCESFIYGGCQGNDNRFSTEQECCQACNPDSGCICELPSETGNCRAAIPRWYYDLKAGKCFQFSYGGCGGNANNFETDWECEGRCGKRNFIATCPVTELPGPCVHTCMDNSQCKPIDICCDNGCGRTCYRPETKEPCELPIDQGGCKARIERWGFNAETQQCERFYYGGCLGNINNFATEAECQESCCRPRKACYQPIVPGPCKGSFQRYAFNINTGVCEAFTYGGCGGNENNFTSLRRCRRKCRKARKNYQCYQPFANQWLCIRYVPTWGYDHCKGECVEYGLCGSTDNHFDTAKDCRKTCMKKKRRRRNNRP